MTHSSITVRFFLRSCRVRDWHRLSCAPGSLPRPFRQPSLGLREPSRRAGKGWSKLMQGSMQACSMAVGQACGLHQLGRGQAKQCRRCLRPGSQLTPSARSRGHHGVQFVIPLRRADRLQRRFRKVRRIGKTFSNATHLSDLAGGDAVRTERYHK